VERYGSAGSLYLTTRNASAETRTFTLAVTAAELGLSAAADLEFEDMLTGEVLTATADGETLNLSDTLAAEEVRMLHPR